MRLRLAEPPRGVARFAYAYLAGLLAAAGAGFVAIVAWAIAGAVPSCRDDPAGWCQQIRTGEVAAVALVGCLFLVAYLLRLGWQWAAWLVVTTLILAQIIVDTDRVGLAWIALALPAVAALLTLSRAAGDPPWLRRARWIALGLAAAQFLVWLIRLLAG